MGVPFVTAWFSPERRGLAIGIVGAALVFAVTVVRRAAGVLENRG